MHSCKSLLKFRLLSTSIRIIRNKGSCNKITSCLNVNYHHSVIVRKLHGSSGLLKKTSGSILSDNSLCPVPPAGLVIGVYVYDADIQDEHCFFTPTGEKVNDRLNGRLMEILKDGAKPVPKLGQVRKIFGIDVQFSVIAVVGLGDPCKGYNPVEQIDDKKEAIRTAAGLGCRAIQKHKVQYVYVDTMTHAESAAEGAALGIWMYQDLKDPSHQKKIPKIEMFDSCDLSGWSIGLHKAAAQNLARFLCESPGNQLTPSLFTQTTVELLSKCGVNVMVRMKHWAKLRNLNAFLTVGKGSCEEPIFLEMLYEGCDPDICPVIIIGKGVTFDSGGLCLKTCHEMKHARGDMSGAAAVVSTLRAVAALQLPINIIGLIPLCENVPGASAVHPGSVIRNVANKSILIRNTDDEGVLMLADALSYAKEFNPKLVIDIGNYTKQARQTIGSAASIIFSNSESLYETLRVASIHTGDRIWRLPLWMYFNEYIRNTPYADTKNLQSHVEGGGVCKAAAFLREFLKSSIDWIHVDTYGVTTTSGQAFTYLKKGMSGRPVRTIIELLAQLSCINKSEETDKCGSMKQI